MSGPPIGAAALAFLDAHYTALQVLAFAPLSVGLALLLYAWMKAHRQP